MPRRPHLYPRRPARPRHKSGRLPLAQRLSNGSALGVGEPERVREKHERRPSRAADATPLEIPDRPDTQPRPVRELLLRPATARTEGCQQPTQRGGGANLHRPTANTVHASARGRVRRGPGPIKNSRAGVSPHANRRPVSQKRESASRTRPTRRVKLSVTCWRRCPAIAVPTIQRCMTDPRREPRTIKMSNVSPKSLLEGAKKPASIGARRPGISRRLACHRPTTSVPPPPKRPHAGARGTRQPL